MMMRMLSLIVLIAISLAVGYVQATVNPDPDQLGLYFDTGAEQNCLENTLPYSTHNVYVIYTHPTAEEILGIKAGIDIDGPHVILGVTVPGNPVNPQDLYHWWASWPEPQPTELATVMVSLQVLYTGFDAILRLDLGSFDDPEDDLPELIFPDGNSVVFGNGHGALAWLNGVCACPTESTSFGVLKALYR